MITKESPLEGMNMGTVATVAIRELPGLQTIDLRVAPGAPAHAAVAEALGIDLPVVGRSMVGKSVVGASAIGGGEVHTLGLAPDWWLIVGLQEAEQKLATLRLNPSGESIKSNKSQYHFSVVDVSGQRTTIELEGPHAREVLAHLWDQDLREKNFPVGSVSQGLMAKAPVIVWHSGSVRYRVMVRSSFAVHVWKALVDAAAQ